jgi:hypothetical protein
MRISSVVSMEGYLGPRCGNGPATQHSLGTSLWITLLLRGWEVSESEALGICAMINGFEGPLGSQDVSAKLVGWMIECLVIDPFDSNHWL